MIDRDTRPVTGPMPAHLEPIFDRYAPQIQRLVSDVFNAVISAGDDRPPAEIENDALSVSSQMVAMAGVAFIARLAAAKECGLAEAFEIGSVNIVERIGAGINQVLALHASRTATKQ